MTPEGNPRIGVLSPGKSPDDRAVKAANYFRVFRAWPGGEPITRRKTVQEKSEPQKEREIKDDGRYIIFYTFEEDEGGED